MAYESIIPIIIGALIVVFAWSIFKKLFKVVFYVGIVMAIIVAGTTFMIYKDMKDLKVNFNPSEKKIILVEENKVLTGLLLGTEVDYIPESDINKFSSFLENGELDKILGDSYKLLIFDISIMDSLGDELSLGETSAKKDDVISKLKDESSDVKSELFGQIVANEILSPKNPLILFSGLKDGTIQIYEETALFKAAKLVPLGLVKSIAGKLVGGAKKANTFIIEEVE